MGSPSRYGGLERFVIRRLGLIVTARPATEGLNSRVTVSGCQHAICVHQNAADVRLWVAVNSRPGEPGLRERRLQQVLGVAVIVREQRLPG